MQLSTSASTARMCWRSARSRTSASVASDAASGSAGSDGKKRLDADPRRLRERHGSLDAVAQFSHVAGPGMIEQGLLSARREAVDVTGKRL